MTPDEFKALLDADARAREADWQRRMARVADRGLVQAGVLAVAALVALVVTIFYVLGVGHVG